MKNLEKPETPKYPLPFTDMAISLSGGGYRASTFHLGALSYLDERHFKGNSLLEHVKILSTISGGTLTGVMYALKLSKGEQFIDCFNKLYKLLNEDKLVDQALHKLNHPRKWKNQYKSRDVINSFAEVYNEEFYDEATFEQFYKTNPGHLTDVIFGSSEFTKGQQFRFQTQGFFGNRPLNIAKQGSEKIRLADAAAASSCFPGGFEPMIMPKDFSNGPDSAVDQNWKQQSNDIRYPVTAIMDGGVLDNQGIEGIEHAESRNGTTEEPFIGTYIISDVSSKSMDAYKVPIFEYSNWKNFFSINVLNYFFVVVTAFFSIQFFNDPSEVFTIVGTGILTLMGIWFVLYFLFRKALRSAIYGAFGGSMVNELVKDFSVIEKTPIYILIYLIKIRLSSVIEMTSDVFMRRIRELQLAFLYKSPKWNYRIKANNIYSLYKNNDPDITSKMKEIVKAANKMPTSLWFSEKEKADGVLDDLITCGQFTLCYNLKKYVEELQVKKPLVNVWNQLKPNEKNDILELEKKIKEDWSKFLDDPYWLLSKNTGMKKLKG